MVQKTEENDLIQWTTMRPIAVLLCALTATWALADPLVYTNVVETTNGPVRGSEIKLGEIKYKSFKGIPYAAPPVGEHRFKAPRPPVKWTTMRDATKYGAICPQPINVFSKMNLSLRMVLRYIWNIRNVLHTFYRYITPSEDCLSLNVYTTQLGESGLKPVLVYFHGGGFLIGDGTDTMYGPEFVVGKDIVLVTLNYRLGALGFLATNTSHATGNWGLKDQILALKWVQENIAKFGGDPQKVTIYGASSGAASVQFHLISPLSKGLFHKAIAASGSSTCAWAINRHPESISKLLANLTGASATEIEDPEKRVEYLRKVDAVALTKYTMAISDNEDSEHGIQSMIPFSPVIEPQGTEGAMITEDPKKNFVEGRFARVPIMTGINSLEGGIMFMGFSKLRSSDDLKKFDVNVCNILPEDLRNAIMARNDCKIVNKLILDVYFGGKGTRSSPLEFTHLFGDIIVGFPTLFSHAVHARYATEENPAYFYNFTMDGKWALFKDMFGVKLPGVLHGDDMHYVFKPSLLKLPDVPPTSPDYHTKVRMVDYITNFVKYGNPTPTKTALTPFSWEPSIGHKLNSMYISSDVKMKKIASTERLQLWDNLYKKYLGIYVYP